MIPFTVVGIAGEGLEMGNWGSKKDKSNLILRSQTSQLPKGEQGVGPHRVAYGELLPLCRSAESKRLE